MPRCSHHQRSASARRDTARTCRSSMDAAAMRIASAAIKTPSRTTSPYSAVDDLAPHQTVGPVGPDLVAPGAAIHAVGVTVVRMNAVVAGTCDDRVVLARRALDRVCPRGARDGAAAGEHCRRPVD